MITEAQKKATKKWEQKYEIVRFRVEKGKKNKIKKLALKNGKSVNNYLNEMIDNELKKNK